MVFRVRGGSGDLGGLQVVWGWGLWAPGRAQPVAAGAPRGEARAPVRRPATQPSHPATPTHRLEVSVGDAHCVAVGHEAQQLRADAGRLALGKVAAAFGAGPGVGGGARGGAPMALSPLPPENATINCSPPNNTGAHSPSPKRLRADPVKPRSNARLTPQKRTAT